MIKYIKGRLGLGARIWNRYYLPWEGSAFSALCSTCFKISKPLSKFMKIMVFQSTGTVEILL